MRVTLMTGLFAVAFLAASGYAAAQELDHFNTIEEAVEAAKKDRKDIIVDFTGSDWCGWCIRLNKEVFEQEEWKKAASKKYVFVELDFPQAKPLSDEQRAYNEKTKGRFGVRGFPSIYVLDSEGRPYAKTGYQQGGAEAYLEHLEEFEPRKKEFADLRREADGKPKGDKLKALVNLMVKLEGWSVAFGYTGVKEEIVDLDPNNKEGHGLKLAKELALAFHADGDKEKSRKYCDIVKKIDPEAEKDICVTLELQEIESEYLMKKKWDEGAKALQDIIGRDPKGEAGQKVYFYAGLVHYQKTEGKEPDKVLELLDKSLKCAPESEMAGQIQRIIKQISRQK